MIEEVSQFAAKHRLFQPGDRLLLACSGGLDSMVLADVLQEMGYGIGLAHCNFELRGTESDGDQQWVEAYAQQRSVPFFTIHFNTRQFAEKNKIGIQEAARFLRYTWLEDVRRTNGYTRIVTAHQQDDQAETILQHITRGTGLQGLQGIPAINGFVVRPMLSVPRSAVFAYASAKGLSWREDSSNAETKYERNFIRQEVLPRIAQLNPLVVEALAGMAARMTEVEALTAAEVRRILHRHTRRERIGESLATGFLLAHPAAGTILYYWLQGGGFSPEVLPDILASLKAEQSGQEFLSATHRLVRDRRRLYLMPSGQDRQDLLLIPALPETIHFNDWEIQCSILPVNELNMKKSSRFAYFDADKVTWPLTLRNRREGDYFYPYGLGKRGNPDKPGKKKLSKYFKDEKTDPVAREHTPVLLSGDKVMWLVGLRSDDRFKVTAKTRQVLKMVVTQGYEKG